MDLQAFKLVDAFGNTPSDELTSTTENRIIRLFLDGDATDVSEVTLLGTAVISFTVSGTHTLDVVLSTDFADVPLKDMEFLVLSSYYTGSRNLTEILFSIGRTAEKAKGSSALIQKWLRFFLMTPGTDPEDPEAGVGILKLSGRVHQGNLASIQGHIARMHSTCKRQILDRQLNFRRRDMFRDQREMLRNAILDRVQLEGDSVAIYTTLIDGLGNRIKVPSRV